MSFSLACSNRMKFIGVAVLAIAGTATSHAAAQEAPSPSSMGPMQHTPPPPAQASAPAQTDATAPAPPPVTNYDPAMFLKRIAPVDLAFLKQYAGAPSGDLYRDRQFHKLLGSVLPNCTFHYGRDMPLSEAMDDAIEGSRAPVMVRDNRFVLVSGTMGRILGGRGVLWFDIQEGIGLGAFFFRPTNGEPTPAVNVFSRQVKEDFLALSEMPPDFAQDLGQWSQNAGIPPLTVRYFLTGENRKIVLEHDEDYCLAWDGSRLPPESGCEQETADAADLDLTAAYYTDATHHVTNATAWMMSQDQVAFMDVRERTCGGVLDPLGCRIRMTRERIHIVEKRGPAPRPVRAKE